MNVLVMDVEGTDGRERGEDQVCSSGSRFGFWVIQIAFGLGFRAKVRPLLPRLIGGTPCQSVGTSSRPVSGSEYGPAQDGV